MAHHPSPHSQLGNEICSLVDTGSLDQVVAWFAAHPTSINIHNSHYQSPLMVAAQSPMSLPVLRYLLSLGASPHYTVGAELGMTALHFAAASSNVYGVALLLAAGADPLRLDSVGRSPLHCGAIAGSNAIVRRLLRAILHRLTVVALAWDECGGLGGPPFGVPGMGLGECPGGAQGAASALMASVTHISRSIATSGETLQSVLSTLALGSGGAPGGPGGSGGPSAFTVAGSSRPAHSAGGSSSGGASSSAAAAHTGSGASSSPRVQPTPVQRAIAMAELRGAVADAVTAYLNGQDDSGYTCLMLAAEHGREDVVKTLLAAGCDVLARNKLSHTAIGVSGREGVLGATRLPLSHCHGTTHTYPTLTLTPLHSTPPHPPTHPLQLADWFGHKSIVALLEASLPPSARAALSGPSQSSSSMQVAGHPLQGGGGGSSSSSSSSASSSAAHSSSAAAAAEGSTFANVGAFSGLSSVRAHSAGAAAAAASSSGSRVSTSSSSSSAAGGGERGAAWAGAAASTTATAGRR
jgi:ankyrin repeat protein